ncbi:MAG: oligosaccharide flippase family protein [Faecalibacterium sp.]
MAKQQSYLKNATVLMASDLVLRLAGMAFRIYLANELGDEGMGLYQLIIAFYAVFITLATAGVSVAATRLVTEEFHTSLASTKGMMQRLLWVATGFGVGAAALQIITAQLAATYWIGDARAASAIQIAALSLPAMAIAAVLRGFFLARRQVQPNVYSQLAEQTVRIGLVLLLLLKTEGASLELRCVIVFVGTTVSETISCLAMAWFYRKEQQATYGNLAAKAPRNAKARIWEIIWPVAGGRVLASGLHTAENMLVPACLALYLVSAGGRTEALAQYGVLKGMAIPLLVFPMGVLGSLATLLMPEITEAHVKGNQQQLARLLHKMFLLTMYASVLAGVAFFVFAARLGELLYQSEQTGFYLKWLAPMAPFMYLENMVTGALKGLGEQKATFRYSAEDSITRILLVVLLLPRFGMMSFLLVMFASNAYTCIMNTRRLLQITNIKLQFSAWVLTPCLAALIAAVASHLAVSGVYLVWGGLPAFGVWALILQLSVGGTVMGLVYLVLIWPLGLRGALQGGLRTSQ